MNAKVKQRSNSEDISEKDKNLAALERTQVEMAEYFEKNISASKLAIWLAVTNYDILVFSSNPDKEREAAAFLSTIGWDLLPRLIECKNQAERIKSITVTLPRLFDSALYEGSRKALVDIGKVFLLAIEKGGKDEEDIYEYMTIYTHFLCLVERYSDYYYYSREISKAA